MIAVRSVFRGRVWIAQSGYLIEDSPERVVTAILPGAEAQQPILPRADQFRALASGEWQLAPSAWHTNRTLWIWPRDAHYGIGLFWNKATDVFRGWYLDLRTPLVPTPIGFDSWDHALDIEVHPNRSWSWKDEDELEEAARLGVLSPAEVAETRAEGERLVAHLDDLIPTGWEDWRPDPAWPPLVLPPGWDRV